MYKCNIIADSVNVIGNRLTTIEITYPRFIHSEIMTHRDRARNSASSRAIPWPKMKSRILENPVVPLVFGSEQKGMQTGCEIDNVKEANEIWLEARDHAVYFAQRLADLGVHKSLTNRLIEPWMWITVIMTATEWKNLFRLRCHPDAEIHFQKIAGMTQEALSNSQPTLLQTNEWHLPYSQGLEAVDLETKKKISVARCARVSYLTHDGKIDIDADLKLFDNLSKGSGFGHFSPFEHPAQALDKPLRSGPFVGWKQYRKEFANENIEG